MEASLAESPGSLRFHGPSRLLVRALALALDLFARLPETPPRLQPLGDDSISYGVGCVI